MADKINLKFCKFILGVNSKSSNNVVLSELGRFSIYFNIVLSMISYLHRLHHCSSNLLKEAFLCNNNLHENTIQTWYSSVIFLLDKLDLKEIYCRDYSINKIKELVIKNLKTLFLKAWFHEKDNGSGKLDTYFSYKSMLQKEKYLETNNIEVRQILCRFRISSHHLRVETERHKNNSRERSQRICKFCSQNDINDEPHFLIKCAFYNGLREELYTKIQNYCKNFIKLENEFKVWLMPTENIFLAENLGHFLIQSFELS